MSPTWRRRRTGRGLAALAGALLLAACGPGIEPTSTPEDLLREGDARAAEGRYADAAELYGRAFALEDPVPERARHRAWLALRRAKALAEVGRGRDALAWVRWAERLNPLDLRVHFLRGQIQDGSHPEATDIEAATKAYRAFLAGWETAGEPEPDRPFAEYARSGSETLGR